MHKEVAELVAGGRWGAVSEVISAYRGSKVVVAVVVGVVAVFEVAVAGLVGVVARVVDLNGAIGALVAVDKMDVAIVVRKT